MGSNGRTHRHPPCLWLLLLPPLVYLLLALPRLGTTSLWLDELMSLEFATEPTVAQVLERLRGDRHAPIFFLLTHATTSVLGNSEFSGRVGAVACGMLAVLALGGLGWALRLPNRTRVAACLVLATSPFFLEYSREVRPYSAAALFVVLSWWAFVRLLRRPGRGCILAYGVSLAGVALTFYLGGLCVAGQAGVLFVLRAGRRRWAAAACGWVLAAVLSSVWLPSFLDQLQTSGAAGRPLDVIENLFPGGIGVHDVARLVTDMAAGPALRALHPRMALVAGLVLLLVVAGRHLRCGRASARSRLAGAVLVCGVLLPLAVFVCLCLVRPILLSRYLAPQSPLVALLLAGSLAVPAARQRAALLPVALVLIFQVSSCLVYHAAMPRTDWRGVAHGLAARMGERDVVVTDNVTARSCLAFSLLLAGRPDLSDNVFEQGMIAKAMNDGWMPGSDQRVWLLERQVGGGIPPFLAAQAPTESHHHAGGLTLHLFPPQDCR